MWQDDAAELKAAGFSDQEIAAHRSEQEAELKQAGFSDQELQQHFGPNVAQPMRMNAPPRESINPAAELLKAGAEAKISQKGFQAGYGKQSVPQFTEQAPIPQLPAPDRYPTIPDPSQVQPHSPQIPKNVQKMSEMRPHDLEDFLKARLQRASKDVYQESAQEPLAQLEELLTGKKLSLPMQQVQAPEVSPMVSDLFAEQAQVGPLKEVQIPGERALPLKQQLDAPIYKPQATMSEQSQLMAGNEARKAAADTLRNQMYEMGGKEMLEKSQPGVRTAKLLRKGSYKFAPRVMGASTGSPAESLLSRAEELGAGPMLQERDEYKEALKLQQGKPTKYHKEAEAQTKADVERVSNQAKEIEPQVREMQKQERAALDAERAAFEARKAAFEASKQGERIMPQVVKAAKSLRRGNVMNAGMHGAEALLKGGKALGRGALRLGGKIAGPVAAAMTAKDLYDAFQGDPATQEQLQSEAFSNTVPGQMGLESPSEEAASGVPSEYDLLKEYLLGRKR